MRGAPLYETFPVIKVESPPLSDTEDAAGVPVAAAVAAAQRAQERRETAGAPWRPPTTAAAGRGRGRRPSGRAAAPDRPSAHARATSRVDARPAGPQPPPTPTPAPRRWSMVLRNVASRRSAQPDPGPGPRPPPPPSPPPTGCEIRTRKRRRRKRVVPRSRSPSRKEKKRRRTPKVKKLVLVSHGDGMWEVKHKRHSRKKLPGDVTERSHRKSANSPKNVESATGEWSHYNQTNGDILLDGEVETIIPPTVTGTQVRNSLSNTEVYESLQSENVYISTSDCSLMNDTDAYIPIRPDDNEADPDVIIVEEVGEAEPDVIIVEEEVDKADPDVVIVGEVTNQTVDKDSCADLDSELVINVSAPPDVRTEFVDMDYSRELVPLEVPERIPETYIGDSNISVVRQQRETRQWHQPQLPVDQWEQQPTRQSATAADYANQTLSQIPLQQIQRQRILQDVMDMNRTQLSRSVMEMNRTQLPRSPPLPNELIPSNEYRWHQPQAFPESSQNQNHPHGCHCGLVHQTPVDRAATTLDRHTLLQGSRLVLCEEEVEKETCIENASQFLKTFHGVHSNCEDPTPHEAVFQEPETPNRQHCQYPKTLKEVSEEYQFQQSFRTVKTEEYQFVKTVFKNSIPTQRYVTAQSVAVDRQVIYKEEYKIIPQPQLEWNISDGCTLGDVNLDLNVSRATLVDVSP